MDNTVQIIPDEMGNVIRVSKNNPEFGHIRLQQERVAFTNTGWVNRKTVSTLLHGKVEDLREMGLHNATTLPGKIVVTESLEPFNADDPDRDLKMAGSTGIVCCQDGQPIYRKTMYTTDINLEDVLIAHTNSDDIRQANTKATEAKLVPEKESKSTQIDLEDSIQEVQAEQAEEVEVEDSTFEL